VLGDLRDPSARDRAVDGVEAVLGAALRGVDDYELLQLNGEPIPVAVPGPPARGSWEGIVDTTKIRREQGFRPIYPAVYTALDAGEL
jgi:hypothetical protein